MKALVLTIFFFTFATMTQPVNAAPAQSNGQIDEWEYAYLKGSCRTALQIISAAEAYAYVPPNVPNNLHSRIEKAFQKEALKILSSGTPAAIKILSEYRSVNWRYPDIQKI